MNIYPIKDIGYIIDLCWLIFFIYWTVSAFGNKADIGKRPQSRFRVPVLILVIVAASVISSYTHSQPLFAYTKFTQAFGVAVCILGVAWAIWARKSLSTNWSAYPTVKQNHELIQSGPYNFSRHPIYTGWIFAFFGTFLAVMTTWAGLLILLIIGIMFLFRIPKEESLMTQIFPDQYPAYKKRVRAALIPFIF